MMQLWYISPPRTVFGKYIQTPFRFLKTFVQKQFELVLRIAQYLLIKNLENNSVEKSLAKTFTQEIKTKKQLIEQHCD